MVSKIISGILNKFTGLIRNTGIQKRLLISFLFASILPLLTVSIYSSVYSSNALTSKISAASIQLLNQTDKSIQMELAKYEDFCNQMAFNDLVQDGLLNFDATAYSSNFDNSKKIVEELLGKYFATYLSGISCLSVYTMDGNAFFDLGYDQIRENDLKKLKSLADKNDGYDIWAYSGTISGTDCLVMCRRIINKNNYSQNLGYFIVGIDEANFSRKVYSDVNLGKGSELFIVNNKGVMMSSNNPELKPGAEYFNTLLLQQIIDNEKRGKHVFRSTYDNKSFLAAYTFNSYAKWYQVATIPYSYINAEAAGFRKSMLLIGGAFLLFAVILAFLIYRSIVNPLKNLLTSTSAISRGNFDLRINDRAPDEIGYLSQRFDIAVEQISRLIEAVKEEQKAKRKTEIQMLQAQINPHFLFNTLNSLKWTAMMSGAVSVNDGLGALAEILRNTILDENTLTSLADEIKNIDNYFVIQKIRYGNMFQAQINIEKELLDCRVLKFILQPIAENSIIHGFDGIEYEGRIMISCTRQENKLLIQINDNGKGFDPGALKTAAGSNKPECRLSSIGIWNVQERIRLNFGDEYGLKIESGMGRGTSVTVTIPCISPQGGDADV